MPCRREMLDIVVVALAVTMGACSGNKSPERGGSQPEAGGSADVIGGGGNQGKGGSAPSQASGGKTKAGPIDCGALGKSCSDAPGCPRGCVAQLDVCMPEGLISCARDADCPARAPICAAIGEGSGACVTEPELDCVCATTMGRNAIARCSAVGAGERVCIETGGLCDTVPCCGETSCVEGSDGIARCEQTCSGGSGCKPQSPDDGRGSCADSPCPPGDVRCCDGHVCAIMGSVRMCKKTCVQNEDCPTSCCATLGDTGLKACLPPEYCGLPFECSEQDESCTTSNDCCAGMSCISMGGTYTCRPRCAEDSDCETGCCLASKNTANSVCVEKSYCP